MTQLAPPSAVGPGPIGRASVRPVHHDFRLVPAAATVWLAALFGLLWAWWAALLCGAIAVLAAIGWLRYTYRRDAWANWRRPAAAGALLVCGVLVIAPLSLRLSDAEQDPLREHAAQGVHAVAHVTVAERPRPVHSTGYANQQGGTRSVVVPVDVVTGSVYGEPLNSSGRMLLVAPIEQWSQVLPGQNVTVRGGLAPARQGELTVAVMYVRGPPMDQQPAPGWQSAAESIRTALRGASSVLADEPAGLLPGLVVGDTSGLSPRVEREFLDAGLSHLTAVSGTNVAIVCGAVLLVLRAFRLGPRISSVVAGLALLGFVVLVGSEPSVLRAGVMGAVGLLAMAVGRRSSALPALAVAVGGLVLYDPAMAVSFGFALSVAATAALVLLAPRWSAALARRGVPTGIAAALTVPVAAFMVTAPIIAGMAGRLSLVSVVANLLAAPVVAPATVFGVLAAVLALVWMPAAELIVHLAGPEAAWLVLVARESAAVPGAVVSLPGGWWGAALVAVVAAILVLALRRRALRLIAAIAVVLVVVVLVPVRVIAPGWPPPRWALASCDVGQGDGFVLPTAEPGRAVVVDTGPDPGPMDDCLDRLDVDRVPLVVVSHLHADHLGGLAAVFEGRSVGAIAVGPGRTPHWAWQEVVAQANNHNVDLLELHLGEHMDWPGLAFDVLGPRYVPPELDDEADGTVINNSSVVLRANTPVGDVLLTGDVELAAQSDLLAANSNLRADILKVPHHGSRYVSQAFLDAVAPRLALVSVGADNTYGHPSSTTLNTLKTGGALVERTDRGGDLAVIPADGGPAVAQRGQGRGPPE